VLQTDKTLVAPSQNVTFIGTNSYDDGRIDRYLFDFGDGTTSGWTTLSLINHTYPTIGSYTASLVIFDDFNLQSGNTATKLITVQNLTPLNVAITLSNDTVDYNGNVSATVYVSDASGPVENADVTLFSLRGGTFSPAVGVTDSAGYLGTTFTAPNVTDTTYIRLIATASKTGYADGACHEYVKVLSLLNIEISNDPLIVNSEETATITVRVTGGSGQPVSNASLILTVDNGNLSANTGLTDVNGSALFYFTAPYTLSPMTVTIAAAAQRTGFTDGYSQKIINVEQRTLTVEVTPSLHSIISEGTTNVAVKVIYNNSPVSNATVEVTSDTGSFNTTTGTTSSSGVVTFVFNAPQTTSEIYATITATASKDRYIGGENQTTIDITPKVLSMDLKAQTYSAFSEAKINVTARITYNLVPVQGVNVTMTSDGGNLSQTSGMTDANGLISFILTAPQVNTPIDITLNARGSKARYADCQNSLTIRVSQGNITVHIGASSYTILPSGTSVLNITAYCNSTAIEGAQVILSITAGNLSSTTGITDSNGSCLFTFVAPATSSNLTVTITANVTKNGYLGGGSQTTLNIVPQAAPPSEGGWPITTILLLLLIPVVIVVIVVVLIKLKVIVVSTEAEETPK
jgi:uncharacterized GH25 family protein